MKNNTELAAPSRPTKGTRINLVSQYNITIKKYGGGDIAEVTLTKKQLDRLRAGIMAIGRDGINGESFAINGVANTIEIACEEVPNEK